MPAWQGAAAAAQAPAALQTRPGPLLRDRSSITSIVCCARSLRAVDVAAASAASSVSGQASEDATAATALPPRLQSLEADAQMVGRAVTAAGHRLKRSVFTPRARKLRRILKTNQVGAAMRLCECGIGKGTASAAAPAARSNPGGRSGTSAGVGERSGTIQKPLVAHCRFIMRLTVETMWSTCGSAAASRLAA